MGKVTEFSTWLHRVLDRYPDIGMPDLRRLWERDFPRKPLPGHASAGLSQTKRRRREQQMGLSSPGGEPPAAVEDQEPGSEPDSSTAALDRLAEIVADYKRVKRENEALKQRLTQLAEELE